MKYQNFLLNSNDINHKKNLSNLEKAYLNKGSGDLRLDYKYNLPKSMLFAAFFLFACFFIFSFSTNFQKYLNQQFLNSNTEVNKVFLNIESDDLEIHEDSTYVMKYSHSIPDLNELILVVNDEDSINQKIYNLNYEKTSFNLPKLTYQKGKLRLIAKSTFFNDVISNQIAFNHIKKFKIEKHQVTIVPPKYTRIKPYIATNVNSLNIIKGSLLKWQVTLNKDLKSYQSNFKMSEEMIFTKRLYREDHFKLFLLDKDSTSIQFSSNKIEITKDRKPLIILRNPKTDIAVSSLEPISFYLSGIDDFGFSKINIEYSLSDPLVPLSRDTIVEKVLGPQDAIFQKQITWNVEETSAFPGMDLYYRFAAYDNNELESYAEYKTNWLKIHFMSMEEMFLQLQEKQEKISKEISENLNERNNIVKELDKLRKKLKQKGDLSFEEKKEIDNLLNKLEDLNNKLKKSQEEVEKLEKEAEKDKLFTEELVSKFNELKELLKNLDLLKQEQKKKPATTMNSNELKKELDNVTKSEEEMKKQLERFQSLLKKMQEKQKKEKDLNQIKDFANKQKSINKQTKDKESSADRNQEKLKNELDNYKSTLEKSKQDLLTKIEEKKVSVNMSKSLKQEQEEKEKTREKIKEDLEQLADQMNKEMKEEDEKEKQELLNHLKTQIDYLLMNSFKQEDLVNKSANMSVYSDEFKPFIRDQYIIQTQLEHIKKELTKISGQTFLFNPNTLKVIEEAISNSQKVIDDLEQRRQNQANRSQSKILANINQSVLMLNENQKSMENAQSALGEKEFQKQMESMAKQQGNLNQQSESLWDMLKQQATDQKLSEKGKAQQKGNQNQEGQEGQSGGDGQNGQNGSKMNGGQGGLGQMQSDLAQQMKELFDQAGENASGNKAGQGRSSEMIEEMKKIAKELSKNKLDEKLIDRQKKLLQKMLDAATSGKEKKEKTKKREKESAKDFEIVDIKELNDDFGQLNSLINQYYEKAINKKYDVYVKEMIQNYFNNLINAQTDSIQILNN